MKPVTAQEIPDTQAFMQDLWKFIKTFYRVEKSKAYHEALHKAMNELNDKYNHNRLHQLLLLSFLQWEAEQIDPEEYKKYKVDRIAEDFIKMTITTEG